MPVTTRKGEESTLSSIFYNPSHPASFGSPRKLYLATKKLIPKITLKKVNTWLAKQEAYSLHRKVVSHFPKKKVLVPYPFDQWQADLVDLSNIKKFNKNYRFVLTVIDCFSRFAWAEILINKRCESVTEAFKKILKKSPFPPRFLQTDKGKEFYGKSFQILLKQENIKHFSTDQLVKAQIVERFNRTLREKLVKYFTFKKSFKYINILPSVLKSYNATEHRSTGFPPCKIGILNSAQVRKNLYSSFLNKKKKIYKFSVGDKVRISKYKYLFHRTHHKTFTSEIFTIVRRKGHFKKTYIPTYIVADSQGEVIPSIFYENELQLFSH